MLYSQIARVPKANIEIATARAEGCISAYDDYLEASASAHPQKGLTSHDAKPSNATDRLKHTALQVRDYFIQRKPINRLESIRDINNSQIKDCCITQDFDRDFQRSIGSVDGIDQIHRLVAESGVFSESDRLARIGRMRGELSKVLDRLRTNKAAKSDVDMFYDNKKEAHPYEKGFEILRGSSSFRPYQEASKLKAAVYCLILHATVLCPVGIPGKRLFIPIGLVRERNKVHTLFDERQADLLSAYKEKRKFRLENEKILKRISQTPSLDSFESDSYWKYFLARDELEVKIHSEYEKDLQSTSTQEMVFADCLSAVNQVIGNKRTFFDKYSSNIYPLIYSSYELSSKEISSVSQELSDIQSATNIGHHNDLVRQLSFGIFIQMIAAVVLVYQVKPTIFRDMRRDPQD